jgi:hypothetical protein
MQADEIVEASSSLKEDVVTEAENSHASLLKNNSRSTTSSSSSLLPSSITVTKCYLSKFKREWLSNPKYSSFLRECKNDTTIYLSGENNNHSDKRKL